MTCPSLRYSSWLLTMHSLVWILRWQVSRFRGMFDSIMLCIVPTACSAWFDVRLTCDGLKGLGVQGRWWWRRKVRHNVVPVAVRVVTNKT